MTLPVILLTLCCFLVIIPLLGIIPKAAKPFIAALPALVAFTLIFFIASPVVRSGEGFAWSMEWFPALGVNLSLAMTGWGVLMALLVTGIGAVIMMYLFGYESKPEKQIRLYTFLSLFMLAMTGLTMSDNLIILFLFWELTSIISYLLVGFYHEKETSRNNALQALLITGAGGMCLLAGLIMLGLVGGSWNISELIPSSELIQNHNLYPSIFTLITIGAFTKSAQFPFHFWLPNAMVAPTPISAYLHSATMVKAGVFLMALLFPVLGGTDLWTNTLMTVGLITLFVGGVFGLMQHDLKAVLAGSTIGVLGLLMFLIGIGTDKSFLALSLFIIGHALYKACLFMVAGSIDLARGTRDTRKLSGLRKLMPITAFAAILAGISKMGLPPFFGFIGKEYAYKSVYPLGFEWLTWVVVLGNAIILALAVKVAILPFFTPKGSESAEPLANKPIAKVMYYCPAMLAVIGLVFGLFPSLATGIVEPSVHSLTGDTSAVTVKLWSGFNTALLMSAVTVVTGIVICLVAGKIYGFLNLSYFSKISPNATFHVIKNGLLAIAKTSTQVLQNGSLRNYLLIILAFTLGLVVWKMSLLNSIPDVPTELAWNPLIVINAVLMLVSIYVAVTSRSKLTSIISLGVVGFGVALFFITYSAPDLAITQILVETLIVVIFAWVIHRIGQYHIYSSRKTKWVDGIVATASGVIITLLVLKSKSLELSKPISDELTAMSYPDGKGSNVVNVILVDFRSFDTLGEITVLTIAALGVCALLSSVRKKATKS